MSSRFEPAGSDLDLSGLQSEEEVVSPRVSAPGTGTLPPPRRVARLSNTPVAAPPRAVGSVALGLVGVTCVGAGAALLVFSLILTVGWLLG